MKLKVNKRLIAGVLALTAAASIYAESKLKLYKECEYDGRTITTSYSSETKENSVSVTKEKLNDLIKRKNIEPEISNLILASYEQLNSNYNNVYNSLKFIGVPSKDEMLNYYYESLDQIEHFALIKDGSAKVGKYIYHSLEDHMALYDVDEDVMVLDIDGINIDSKLCDLFLHETTHANQKRRGSNDKLRSTNLGMYYLLKEGENALLNCCTSDMVEFNSVNMCSNLDGTESIVYGGRAIDSDYNIGYKLYIMLMHLTSYDDLKELLRDGDIELFKSKISKEYDIDVDLFISNCEALSLSCYHYEDCDKEKCLKDIDTMFIECLCKDLDKLSKSDDVIDFYNFYRFYKLQYQTILKGNSYDFSKLEDELYKKCLVNNFMVFFEDEMENRKIFNLLLEHSEFETDKDFSYITNCMVEYDHGVIKLSKNGKETSYFIYHNRLNNKSR